MSDFTGDGYFVSITSTSVSWTLFLPLSSSRYPCEKIGLSAADSYRLFFCTYSRFVGDMTLSFTQIPSRKRMLGAGLFLSTSKMCLGNIWFFGGLPFFFLTVVEIHGVEA